MVLQTPPNGWIPVYFPEHRVKDAYRLLLDEEEPAGDPAPAAGPPISPNVDWSAAQNIKRLRQALRHHAVPTWLLDQTAAQPGRYVPLWKAEEALGKTHDEVRAQMGSFTKIIKREFNGRDNWPFEFRRDENNRVEYQLPQEVADAWLASA